MKLFKSIALISVVTFSFVTVGMNGSTASPFNRLSTSAINSAVEDQSMLLDIRQYRSGHKRRYSHGYRHNRRHYRPRHQRQYRGHRRHHGGIWYSIPYWIGPLLSVPPQYNRCDKWSRRCYRNWGPGPNYRGCMRYQGCR